MQTEAAAGATQIGAQPSRTIPEYLLRNYWWAYVNPGAVRLFERQWLVNVILCGNFALLRDAVLDELGVAICGRTLQVACVYGDFSVRLADPSLDRHTLPYTKTHSATRADEIRYPPGTTGSNSHARAGYDEDKILHQCQS